VHPDQLGIPYVHTDCGAYDSIPFDFDILIGDVKYTNCWTRRYLRSVTVTHNGRKTVPNASSTSSINRNDTVSPACYAWLEHTDTASAGSLLESQRYQYRLTKCQSKSNQLVMTIDLSLTFGKQSILIPMALVLRPIGAIPTDPVSSVCVRRSV
jgi:hypothetical protein